MTDHITFLAGAVRRNKSVCLASLGCEYDPERICC